jgi:hypothetical protein
MIHTEPVPEKSRPGVADKVKAVAASAAKTTADDAVEDAEIDEEYAAPVTDGEELDADALDGDDLGAEAAGTGRRRTRRGGTRRRTRP